MEIIANPAHALHNTAGLIVNGQPFVIEEVPERIERITVALAQANLGPFLPASDHGIAPLLAVHPADYLEYLQSAYARHAAHFGSEDAVVPGTFAPRAARRATQHIYGQAGQYAFGIGAPILKETWQAAYWSAQCALSGADRLLAGAGAVFALCRPPGHHAHANLCGGFCYLNNVAIAARYLQTRRPGTRVAILDIDYHHGNGSQEIFYSDASVLFCSLHAHPDQDYPYYWGAADETGDGAGAGCNRNYPLPIGCGDELYLDTLAQALGAVSGYRPDFLLISAGFDTAKGDPVGGFAITLDGMGAIGRRCAALRLPTLMVLEGGYLLEKLGEYALRFLRPFDEQERPGRSASG